MMLSIARLVAGVFSNVKVAAAGALLRFSSPYHRLAARGVMATGEVLRCGGRYTRDNGSSDKKALYVQLSNFAMKSDGTVGGYGSTNKVIGCYIECNGVSVQVTWNGDPQPVLGDGAYDIVSDRVPASAFGLPYIARNASVKIREEREAPIGGYICVNENSEYGGEAYTYYPSACTYNNLSGVGPMSFTGTKSGSYGTSVILLGESVSGDARVWIGAGDSIINNGVSSSYFMDALKSDASALISGCVVGRVGGHSPIQDNYPEILGSYAKYANSLVEEYGTNTANGSNLVTMQTIALASWAFWRTRQLVHPQALPFVIVRPYLLVRTTGTFTTLAGQTVATSQGWDAGGTVENLHAWYETQVGLPNGISSTGDIMAGVRGSPTGKGTLGSDYYKWDVSVVRTTDGLHPASAGALPIGVNLKSYMMLY